MSTNKAKARMVLTDAIAGAADVQAALEVLSDPWATQPIGVPVPLSDDIEGILPPPRDRGYRYILLTAGEDGSGGYNEGVLTSESVSGSSPAITATAEIDFAGSPLHGETIHLINTERRFLRAGNAGVVQDDAFKSHTHQQLVTGGGGTNLIVAGGTTYYNNGPTPTGPTGGDETRPRNIGVTYYMRIM